MSSIQLIDAANIQAAVSNQQIDAEASNGLLLNLHEALETLMTTQAQEPSADVKASLMKKLNDLGQQLKKVYDKNDELPKANIQMYFYFLGMLNQDEVDNAQLLRYMRAMFRTRNMDQERCPSTRQHRTCLKIPGMPRRCTTWKRVVIYTAESPILP